jgi:hypothetical protein
MLKTESSLVPMGDNVTPLDDETLAAIVGGGPLGTILREAVSVLWNCVKDGLDEVISAAEEGFADARET